MPVYRLYFLDPHGRIAAVRELDCADDVQAVSQASNVADGRGMELWDRDRRVKVFAAMPEG